MKEYFSKYQQGNGYAVIRRVAPDKEWIIFYSDTLACRTAGGSEKRLE